MERINPKMIELGRISRGLTQKELATKLPHLNQPVLSKIEKGEFNITKETLESIAGVLNYPTGFFYQEELKTPFSNIYFRKRSVIPQKVLDRIFADVKLILKGIDHLLEEIELKEYPKYAFNLTNGWTPESVAIRMRELFKIHPGPVKNLITLIEEAGIIVYFYDSPDEKFDGLTAYTNAGYPVIFVNKNMPNDRIRFTVSHELGHLVMHIPCDVEPWRDVEDEANNFASEFLMPKKDCNFDLYGLTYNKLGILKAYWCVSKAAIVRRAKTVNAINEATYRYLMVELGRRNERKSETGYVEIDEPKILKQVIELLRTELQYTTDVLANSMYLPVDDYVRLFDLSDENKPRLRKLKIAI